MEKRRYTGQFRKPLPGGHYRHTDHENPWDGNDRPQVSAKVSIKDNRTVIGLSLLFWSLLILSYLFLAGNLKAGEVSSDRKAPKEPKPRVVVNLDQESKEAAEDYAYILEQLLYLSTDYCNYFQKLDDRVSSKNYEAIAQMCKRISKEEKYENVKDIIREIKKLKEELADREHELQELQEELESESSEYRQAQSNLKALKLTTTLKDELASLDDQLEHEVVWRLEADKANEQAINHYVKAIIEESVSRAVESVNKVYVPRVHIIEDENGEETVVVEVAPDGSRSHSFVHIPDPPTPPTHTTPPAPTYQHFSGNAFFNELRDSLKVTSPTVGIYITNSIGDLEISAWPERMVKATYSYGVVSEKQRQSEILNKEIHLRVFAKQDKIYIESVMPPLIDPKMRVLNSRLEVKVPLKNSLFISNSSGNVNIVEIRNDVVVKGANCNINIDRIDGNTDLSNSSGTIVANGILGKTIIQNRMGPVTMFDCNGDINIDNSFGPIALTNCDGDAVVRNSGPVTVAGHVGNMEINNRSGLVDAGGIDGNLIVFNSFEPTKIRNVNGTAKLVSANAPVEATGIDGAINISNRFAPISIASVSGPLYLENKSGDINMHLSRVLSGESQVITSGGTVNMDISPRNNLSMSMELTNGDLSIYGFEATVDKRSGGVQLANFKIGSGANTFSLKSANTRVLVKPAQ